jgi:alpha-L-fucosidase
MATNLDPRTAQQLADDLSDDMMRRAALARRQMRQVIDEGPFAATVESLATHTCPNWFDDAKFGMFLDWGLYSAAGWGRSQFDDRPDGPMYPDWYLWDMYEREEGRRHHAAAWGESFARDDFIPLFTAADYDPAAIAALAREAGMKYVVPFCKHHDGYCLWQSQWTLRHSAATAPGRDLLAPLAAAVRQEGLKFGAYFSVDEWEYPILDDRGKVAFERQWEFFQPRLAPFDERRLSGRIGGKVPVRDFVADYLLPQGKELIDLLQPDLLWYDGEWRCPAADRGTLELAAYFYNSSAAAGREVAVNDRFGEPYGPHARSRGLSGDFYTSEYNIADAQRADHKWEECRSIGRYYGYYSLATDADVLTGKQLIHLLVDIVSRNGNLLLLVNPTASGAITDLELSRLRAVGRWLRVCGQAIYATRPVQPGELACGGGQEGVRLTRGRDGRRVFAICLAWPTGQLRLRGPLTRTARSASMLGSDLPLECQHRNDELVVTIPDSLAARKPCDDAWVVAVDVA